LFAGTRRDNCVDMIAKGRHRPGRGERQRDAKLSYREADCIRWLHTIGASHRRLAREYNVSRSNIARILDGKIWIEPLARAA
jgi:hypothetical protein